MNNLLLMNTLESKLIIYPQLKTIFKTKVIKTKRYYFHMACTNWLIYPSFVTVMLLKHHITCQFRLKKSCSDLNKIDNTKKLLSPAPLYRYQRVYYLNQNHKLNSGKVFILQIRRKKKKRTKTNPILTFSSSI